jgi:glycerate dehydrogenase
MKIVVLDGHTLDPGDLDWNCFIDIAPTEIFDRTPESEVVERAHDAEIILTNKTKLPAAVLQALPKLCYIGVLATGYDVVDVSVARERTITVTNIPSYGTAAVAQFVFALLLELCHHVGLHSEAVRSGDWSHSKDFSLARTPLVGLAGKTMGIVGFGRIGQRVAKIASVMGMEVLATVRQSLPASAPHGVECGSLDTLLVRSDVLSLHCPLTSETRNLINAETLSRIRPTAFLINTSRGALVDEIALADALNYGRLAGAALDVLTIEPPPGNHPLFHAKNCLITPHIAWATKEARARLMDLAADNLKAFLSGRPKNMVV